MRERALLTPRGSESGPSDLLAELSRELDTIAYWHGQSEAFDHAALVTTARGNRWNVEGQPAVYLAGDLGLVLVEAGRHLGPLDGASFRSVIWRVRVRLGSVLDLREEPVRRALRLDDPHWVLDRTRCRDVVALVRARRVCQAIRTPSAGLPDAQGRWNLVLFPDLLEVPLKEAITQAEMLGSIRSGG